MIKVELELTLSRLSTAHINHIQGLLITYEKKMGIKGGNVNEYSWLYIQLLAIL